MVSFHLAPGKECFTFTQRPSRDQWPMVADSVLASLSG